MPFVLLHFHKGKGPAGTLHRFSSGLLPQSGGAVLPPVSWANGRPPIFSADSSNRTVRGNTVVDPPETSVPRFFAGHISCGAGPDCHRSGQNPVPVSFAASFGERLKSFAIKSITPHLHRSQSSGTAGLPSCWGSYHRERDSSGIRSSVDPIHKNAAASLVLTDCLTASDTFSAMCL